MDDWDRCNVSIDWLLLLRFLLFRLLLLLLLLLCNKAAAVSRRVHSGISVSVSDLCDSPLMDVSPAKWNDWRLTSLSRKLRYVDESDLLTALSSSCDLFCRPACFFSRCLEPLNTSMTTGDKRQKQTGSQKESATLTRPTSSYNG
jgi:hypothetical protein